MVDEDIRDAIYQAAEANDARRLDALSKTFPDQFRITADDGLLQAAYKTGSPDAMLYLLLEHHCLMPASSALEIDRECMGEPAARLHRTLEVFAEAAMWENRQHRQSDQIGLACCSRVRQAAQRAGRHETVEGYLDPYVLQGAADATLQRWFVFLHEYADSNGIRMGRHSGDMLKALEANFHYLASDAPTERIALPERSIAIRAAERAKSAETPPRR